MNSLSRIAFLGGYVPRLCGIATFTHDLFRAVNAGSPGSEAWIAAVTDRPDGYDYPPEVRLKLDERDPDSYRRVARHLNFSRPDVLCVQHEFGIYGGPAGSHLLTLLKEVNAPVVTTLHTILANPDIDQRRVMDELIRRSARMVVMAERGARILRDVYDVDPQKIDVIPHGIPDVPLGGGEQAKKELSYEGRRVLLTFGLLGPGKGIEYAIRAMPAIVEQVPDALYVILGATHPHLVAREGERYRRSLEELAKECGVGKHVVFDNRFVSPEDLERFMTAADIYLTPYPNEAQITSGTLARAFGAGKAVVSTPYWHAEELLAEGAGVLVPSRDAEAISQAVCRLLGNPEQMMAMCRRAHQDGRAMIWPAVAQRYLEAFGKAASRALPVAGFLARTPLPPVVRLEHVERMSDGTGIFQHATYNVPNFHEGYCTDDNARAFLLCLPFDRTGGVAPLEKVDRLATTYLAFLAAAFNPANGRFRNFMSHGRVWLEEAGSEDSHGRAVWAVGTGCSRTRNDGHRMLCLQLFQGAVGAVEGFTSPRAWAFAMLGIHEYLKAFPGDLGMHRLLQSLGQRLMVLWKRCSRRDWRWCEDILSYDNARIAQALIVSGSRMPGSDQLKTGLEALQWLAEIQTASAGYFRPVGSNGFYPRKGVRADYDQQPLEAQAMVSACLDAWRVTSQPAWLKEARRAFDWFLGGNDLGLPLFDSATGGCCDGLQPAGLNVNQGAESSLAFSLSLAEMLAAEATLSESVKQIA
ncbi:glycosyltransferase family 4 protein [Luteolibacter arcticus]|uniref:Glycosyltransferase family 4 protein n=1 Tax=Luteolibacter arcticus TaxID=1581411 RepID=A0ABT3GML6_9BACT|nr:glycosyltransferase family 4 protein [Luteolibacter arcticus]MCW1924754.1 glycosyltransferase family 4 protein [Luteolibacter arcticus]